jgi:hypothetical protein
MTKQTRHGFHQLTPTALEIHPFHFLAKQPDKRFAASNKGGFGGNFFSFVKIRAIRVAIFRRRFR